MIKQVELREVLVWETNQSQGPAIKQMIKYRTHLLCIRKLNHIHCQEIYYDAVHNVEHL